MLNLHLVEMAHGMTMETTTMTETANFTHANIMQPNTTSHAMQTTTKNVFQWSIFVNRHSINTAKAVAPNDPDPNPEDWKFLCFCQSEAEAHAEVETLAAANA